jgi:cephalosporin hydroxylase
VRGNKVLVSLDSDHVASHVLNELHAYAPMVSQGSYIVVEDTHLDGVPTQPGFGPGPFSAVTEFLREGGSREFAQDFSRESLGITYYPGGWLRRYSRRK